MLGNEMLGKMLDEAVRRIQHSIHHLKTKFVLISVSLQILDEPTWVVKRIQHYTFVFSMLNEILDAFYRGLMQITVFCIFKLRRIDQ